MELHDYVRILRKRWRAIAVAALIGLIAAGAFIATATKKYTASTRLFVSTQNTADASLTAAVQGSQFSAARVTSYADIVNTPPVMQGVIDSLHLSVTPQVLAGQVSASAPANTVLLNISVTDTSPAQAALLANTVATSFVKVVTDLERPADGSPSPVRVTIVKQASVPGAPTSPNRKIDLGLGLILGLIVGVGVAVLRDTLDTSVKKPDEMAELTGAATLAVIGFDPEVASIPLIIDGSPHAPRAEALRQLRTNLQFVDVDNPPKSVLVTSAVPKEGKSSTTANLAMTLARGGLKVILVEGDLRRPRIARYLGLPDDLPGITDVLVGKYTLDEALVPFRDEPVMVLSSGSAPPNPSEVLGSAAMRQLIRDLEARADIVLIDAPPLLPVTDGAVLASICDGAVYVVRAGKTHREQVIRAIENLKSVDAHLLGCVLNMASSKGPEAYAYGYGYDYSDAVKPSRFSRKKAAKGPVAPVAVAKPAAPKPAADLPALELSALLPEAPLKAPLAAPPVLAPVEAPKADMAELDSWLATTDLHEDAADEAPAPAPVQREASEPVATAPAAPSTEGMSAVERLKAAVSKANAS